MHSDPSPLPGYAELCCRSNFSFLTGASHPEELVERAQQLGYGAIALTDECSLAGVVRAHEEAKRLQLPFIVGATMQLAPPSLAAVAVPLFEPEADETDEDDDEADVAAAAPVAAAVAAPRAAGTRRAAVPAQPSAAVPPLVAADAATLGPRLVLLARTRRGYGNLVRWITVARERAGKGAYTALMSDIEGKEAKAPMLAGLPECHALLVASTALLGERPYETLLEHAQWLKTWFGAERAALALPLLMHAHQALLVDITQRVASITGLPIAAVGDVLMHVRSRKPLQDALTATRLKRTLAECGFALAPNAEQHLRSRARLASLYRPRWLEKTIEIASACKFSLDELRYEYPKEIVPDGHTPATWLRQLTEHGLSRRYPAPAGGIGSAVPPKVRADVERELCLIAHKSYEAYFLTVADLVHWAREQHILCQGRGSAANSVVCYALGVTEVDPNEMTLLFERFVSAERDEPPDIDIDFEHQRREEVIQYVYKKYGRHRAALTAVVISYRPRSALRDMGRVLGIDLERIESVAKTQHWFDGRAIRAERLSENGFDPDAPITKLWVELTETLIGFPRHLSQHPGGFVIARDDLAHLVPVENAAMENRSVIQWDKDDLDALKLLKVDVLALGMLSAIRRALEFIGAKVGGGLGPGGALAIQQLPRHDDPTYEMLCRADSVGVFQVESRAQMSMLPRLQPRKFYDLVIEVAIVRPGPIQGGMVHPFLRRRTGEEPEDYPGPEVKQALERTLGVPIFQEQVMQIAMLAADFTGGEADQLRRAMAAWKRKGGLGPFRDKLVSRMKAKGYSEDFAGRLFKQIEGFGEYGFPESHAASFAKLVYVSAWIKRHHPDAFLAALLNSQPMGFYAPAQLVRDAREHGVAVLPVDVCASEWETVLEGDARMSAASVRDPALPVPNAPPRGAEPGREQSGGLSAAGEEPAACGRRGLHGLPRAAGGETALPETLADGLRAVRLGFSRITGLREDAAKRLVAARAEAPFANAEDLARRARLDAHQLSLLAHADALRPLVGHRHQSAWAVAGVDTRATPLLQGTRTHEAAAELAPPRLADTVLADYRSVGLSLTKHPLALLREQLAAFRVQPAAVLRGYPDGRLARASGIVTHRQRPETAKGVIFVTLEDETGAVNVIVWPLVAESQRKALLASSLLTVYGIWQSVGEVRHLIARKLVDHSALLQGLDAKSRNFR